MKYSELYKEKFEKTIIRWMVMSIIVVILGSSIISSASAYIQVPGVGNEGQGADIAIANINGGTPDMILMAYDNPVGANTFRYKIGWNISSLGIASAWTPGYIEVPGVGNEGQGAGVAIANLNGGRPDMILMAYDNPVGANTFRYKIGWNLSTAGIASSWTPGYIEVPGVGNEGQGAGVAIANLDSNPRPEMILMAYDNPSGANTFRYKIGWNLDNNGIATSWDAGYKQVPGVGFEGQGAGIAIANIDGNPRPDMILMAYDNPVGANTFRLKIGYNLNTLGTTTDWDDGPQVPGVGNEGQGAGIAIANLNLDRKSSPDMILMAYDNPVGANTFRYQSLIFRTTFGLACGIACQ